MIEKEKVVHVMQENSLALCEESGKKEEEFLECIEWSRRRRELYEWLIALPADELVDLVALKTCGRENSAHGILELTVDKFREVRNGIERDLGQKSQREIALYLMQNKKVLSTWLQLALSIYEEQ